MGLLFYKWSRTSESNSTADANVNWAEGQPPSSVNDSARAMMASLAGYRDDTAGAITTGGTSTAYTLTTYQVFNSLANMNGQEISFTVHATNGTPVTLNVDGLGARAVGIDQNTAVPAATLIAGSPYTVLYSHSLGIFILKSFHQLPFVVPLGAAIPYFGATAPSSIFAFPYGQSISRTTYASLFALFGTAFGSDDGATFKLPDIRGRVIAGKDDMGGSAANRITSGVSGFAGTGLGNFGGLESHTLVTGEMPSHSHGVNDPGHTHGVTGGTKGGTAPNVVPLNSGAANAPNNVTDITISTATTGITIQNAGSGSAHRNMQPTIIGNYILRII